MTTGSKPRKAIASKAARRQMVRADQERSGRPAGTQLPGPVYDTLGHRVLPLSMAGLPTYCPAALGGSMRI